MREVPVVQKVLKANDLLAEKNREEFARLGLFVVNLMGTPGAGKTALLEKTFDMLDLNAVPSAVIEGDIATTNDATRLAQKGVQVVQINTNKFGNACHLDAGMVQSAMEDLDLNQAKLLFIENVGNLVCPAGFDLGETARAVVLSVTEGEDKPLKYPVIFRSADAVVITKSDLLPHLNVSEQTIKENIGSIQPKCKIFTVSAQTGSGMQQWLHWLVRHEG